MPTCDLCRGDIIAQQIIKNCCKCNKFFHLECLTSELQLNTNYLDTSYVPWICAPCKVNLITEELKNHSQFATATVSDTLQMALAINSLMNRMLKMNDEFIAAQKDIQAKLFDITNKMYSAYELTTALENCVDSLLEDNSQHEGNIDVAVPKPPAAEEETRKGSEGYHTFDDDLLGA